MIVVYDSLTGNVERFVSKLGFPSIKITKGLKIEEPFVLITYTIGFGQVPSTVMDFLYENGDYLKAVAGSGNMNWGNYFCGAADVISQKFNIPVIHKFELSGTNKDVEKVQQEVKNIVKCSKLH